MKIIFLDIDGVLNTFDTYIEKAEIYRKTHIREIEIDIKRLEYLKNIIDETDAHIVLISSWRFGFSIDNGKIVPIVENARKLIELFNKYGIEIYDIATKNKTLSREQQIENWLKTNDVESFIILTTETKFFSEYQNNVLIKIKGLKLGQSANDKRNLYGLCENHIEEAINILNTKDKKIKKKIM